jgi:hypothetical protein
MRLALLLLLAAVGVAAAAVVSGTRAGEPDSVGVPTASRSVPAAEAAKKPGPGIRETCATRSEGDFGRPFEDPRNLVAGPLVLVGGARFTTPSVVRGYSGQKFPVLVRAEHSVTLAIPEEARTFAGLAYGPLPQGEVTLEDTHEQVTFSACPADEPSYSRPGSNVGATTFWSGSVVVREPHCVPVDVWVDDDPKPRRIVLELGVKPCAGADATI